MSLHTTILCSAILALLPTGGENKKRGCAEEGAAGLGEQVILPLKVFMVHLVIIHARHIYSVGFFSKHDLSAR
jgi:hypothetical protein